MPPNTTHDFPQRLLSSLGGRIRRHDIRRTKRAVLDHYDDIRQAEGRGDRANMASTEMVRRYAHLAADHLAPSAERFSALRTVASETDGTFTSQA